MFLINFKNEIKPPKDVNMHTIEFNYIEWQNKDNSLKYPCNFLIMYIPTGDKQNYPCILLVWKTTKKSPQSFLAN